MTAPSAAPALLVAVTGHPGEGRTALLAGLAADFRAAGRRVEGLLAVAEGRDEPGCGARRYRLHVLGESGEHPWAERVADAGSDVLPSYEFHAAVLPHLRLWADGLRGRPPADLLVLDEFGPLEARGEGLMPLWPALAASGPMIVVLSVREHVVAEIEQRLGRRFDVRIDAGSPDAATRLRQVCAELGEWTRLGLWGGATGGIEFGAGTLLHAARVPFRGLALSSLQAAMLTFASAGLTQPGRCAWVALIAAGLKALSPGGSRFRPMAAIAMQGLLFGASVQVLGWNAAGLALGGALIGVWAALQGFFLQYLFLGEELVNTYSRVIAWVGENFQLTAPGLATVLACWAALHAVLAATGALAAWRWRAPPRALQGIIDREIAALPLAAAKAAPPSRRRRIAREFARWQFWLPAVIVVTVLLASGGGWEPAAWVLVRFVAVGLVVAALFSLVQPAWIARNLRRRGWWGPAAAFAGALRRTKD